MYTLISTSDLEKLINFKYTWSPSYNTFTKSFYAHTIVYPKQDSGIKNYKISLQDFLMNPDNISDVHVDHINHDTLDNRRCNLRVTSRSDNYTNRNGRNSNNKSGYRNVFWNNAISKWSVRLCKNYKQIHIGDFDDVDEAGRVAEEARKKYYGKFAGTNDKSYHQPHIL